MICSNCGTDNEKGFRFCVKCGSNIEDPSQVNYEQVDMGNYHSEEEFSDDRNGFTMSTDTFVIRDTAPPAPKEENLFTADELNRSEEEFDFSMYDEPAMSALPPAPAQPAPQPQFQPQQPAFNQQMQNANPYIQQPVMYQQPQIIGYDASGAPIYSQPQPMMYQQPQIIGYDASGAPIYGQPQPMMFQQPQIIGYDASGAPIYNQPQPMMYQPPQIIGYDASGAPIYGQQNVQPVNPMMSGMQMPGQAMMNGMPQTANIPQQPPPPPPKQEETPKKEESVDFWAFFNGDSKEEHRTVNDDDFFGKSKTEPISSGDPFADLDNRRKKRMQEAMPTMMSDTPIVDASKLERNDANRINRLYMRQTGNVMSADLTVGNSRRASGEMETTAFVDADMLSENVEMRSRITMQYAGRANADDMEAFVPQHKEALMAQADHAVQAMPKKKDPYESELDRIELPEYMQAKKTSRDDIPEIPSIPEI